PFESPPAELDDVEVVEVFEPEPPPEPEPAVDTAALLRELASLGGFNDVAPEPTQTSKPVKSGRPSAGPKEQDKKKKKGLFGR
ncbi:MAG: hypothetical protein ABI586_02450, partial [Candidatus Nanopelagicales bacterium]